MNCNAAAMAVLFNTYGYLQVTEADFVVVDISRFMFNLVFSPLVHVDFVSCVATPRECQTFDILSKPKMEQIG